MKSNQTVLVRAIQGSLSDLARVCSRYNKAVVFDKLGDVDVACRSTKLVLADYSDRMACFTLKIMQIVPTVTDDVTSDTLSTMVTDAIDSIARGDSTFKMVDTAADGLKHSGLNSSYVYALRDIANCVADTSSSMGMPVTKIQYMASATFGNSCVGMVFVYANSVFILQFMD